MEASKHTQKPIKQSSSCTIALPFPFLCLVFHSSWSPLCPFFAHILYIYPLRKSSFLFCALFCSFSRYFRSIHAAFSSQVIRGDFLLIGQSCDLNFLGRACAALLSSIVCEQRLSQKFIQSQIKRREESRQTPPPHGRRDPLRCSPLPCRPAASCPAKGAKLPEERKGYFAAETESYGRRGGSGPQLGRESADGRLPFYLFHLELILSMSQHKKQNLLRLQKPADPPTPGPSSRTNPPASLPRLTSTLPKYQHRQTNFPEAFRQHPRPNQTNTPKATKKRRLVAYFFQLVEKGAVEQLAGGKSLICGRRSAMHADGDEPAIESNLRESVPAQSSMLADWKSGKEKHTGGQ